MLLPIKATPRSLATQLTNFSYKGKTVSAPLHPGQPASLIRMDDRAGSGGRASASHRQPRGSPVHMVSGAD